MQGYSGRCWPHSQESFPEGAGPLLLPTHSPCLPLHAPLHLLLSLHRSLFSPLPSSYPLRRAPCTGLKREGSRDAGNTGFLSLGRFTPPGLNLELPGARAELTQGKTEAQSPDQRRVWERGPTRLSINISSPGSADPAPLLGKGVGRGGQPAVGRAGPHPHPHRPPPAEERGAALPSRSPDPSSPTAHPPSSEGSPPGRFLGRTGRPFYYTRTPRPSKPPGLFSGPRAPSAGAFRETRSLASIAGPLPCATRLEAAFAPEYPFTPTPLPLRIPAGAVPCPTTPLLRSSHPHSRSQGGREIQKNTT